MTLPMQTSTWAVIDTETTGPDPATARLVEVAVALFRGGAMLAPPRSWLVNPGVPIPPEASAVHGISDAMVAGSPPFAMVLPELCAAIADADVMVGYNAVHFDMPILAREASALRPDEPSLWDAAIAGKPVVDPLVIVRVVGRYWPGKGRHRLGNVCSQYRIDAEGAHRASADVVMTGRLLWALGPEAAGAGLPSEAGALTEELGRLAVRQEADFQAWKARQG